MLARLAFFLLLIVPPMALAADAPPGGGKFIIVKPPAKAAAAPAPAAPMLPQAPAVLPAPRDASDCRMDCSQTYYLCRTDDQSGDCGGGWSQCLAACNSPNLAMPPAFSTAP
ncbi:MAG TPA: hypothetical protein VGF50_05075 [Caulobacteraceae bacterium]